MAFIEVEGHTPLKGTVRVSGSKNGSLPLLAATILSDGEVHLGNVPEVVDTRLMCELLRGLGLSVARDAGGMRLEVEDESPTRTPYELVEKMRASICVLGPLVARRGKAQVAQPGGCSIGPRPIDIHLRGLRALGAQVRRRGGEIIVTARRLVGAEIDLLGKNGRTVLGTCNVMSAATLAEGRTVLTNAACEPEVTALAQLLLAMGAKIEGVGTDRLVIEGVPNLHGARQQVIPDRIEAGTYMAAAAISRGQVLLENVVWEHVAGTVGVLRSAGVHVEQALFGCEVAAANRPRSVHIATAPYPGFATDLQAPVMSLLCLCQGQSSIRETVFPGRFTHVDELNRLGASITVTGSTANIEGVERLSGTRVTARDLRACAALVVASLAAEGRTIIRQPEHIDRGYERIEEKLAAVGARIRRVAEDDPAGAPTA